jgi:tetratricopeptide (TPR) repeat protein
VRSKPAPDSDIDPAELADVNEDALFATGVELLDLWHLPEAIDVFNTLVTEFPGNLDAHLKLVECYSHPIVGSERRAESSWTAAANLAREAGLDTVWVKAIRELFIDYMPEAAIAGLTDIVNRDGENVDARVLLARALLMNGEAAEAERYLGDLLGGDQSLGRARELLIQCKVIQGKLSDAEGLAKDLIGLYPEEPYPYVLLSRVHLIQGNADEATNICDNALLLDRRYVPAIVCRAHAYIASGEIEAARVSFEKLLMFDDAMLASIGTEGIAYTYFLFGRFHAASEWMDEAIRLAMSVGSARRGMLYAFRFVDYLCELGRAGAADAVLDRWVSRYTEIPTELGELRILISRGNLPEARRMMGQIEVDERWQSWMRSLSLDYADLEAMAYIQEEDFEKALGALGVPPAATARRAYLTGYAAFQDGDAESAMGYFQQTRARQYSVMFPYHTDPILFVQSAFFLAEAALARGESNLARDNYADFLALWGDADWDLQAVERARTKLETLSNAKP